MKTHLTVGAGTTRSEPSASPAVEVAVVMGISSLVARPGRAAGYEQCGGSTRARSRKSCLTTSP